MKTHGTSDRWVRKEKAIKRKIARKSGPVKEFVAQADGTIAPIKDDARERQTKSRKRALLRGPK